MIKKKVTLDKIIKKIVWKQTFFKQNLKIKGELDIEIKNYLVSVLGYSIEESILPDSSIEHTKIYW